MLRTVGDQPTLWEAILPAELRRLPEELARVDVLVDDAVFLAPFVPFFDPRIGRPSTPMETYLRLMFLKFRYRLGFESLCREVSDSITWRQFCRIGIDQPVPHPTTLMKLTTRCGSAAVEGLNQALLAKAVETKVLRCSRIRVDTTVVPSNVAYPRDSGLLAKAVNRIAATGRRIRAAGRDEALEVVHRKNAELADLAETAANEAERLLANAKRALRKTKIDAEKRKANGHCDAVTGRRRGRLVRAVNDLTELLDATRKIVEQTRERLAGRIPDGATRQVSLHDPDARPIRK